MSPEQIDRVFGRGRLKMATGEHVEVFREAVAPGERRRYTKRFLNTQEGDFGQWTEREWRILARLIGHGIACVPDVVQFDRGRLGGMQLVQTYDAGVTVDQWATLLPVKRDGRVYGHVFEDCAHWWALAHYCLLALNVIHPLELVHLDVKGDNVCIPYAPASFDPDSSDLRLQPVFAQLALIDFAFALISRERLTSALPIGWQKDYDYQSPRLLTALEAGRNGELQLTRELDWRCDMYSLAAMLKRYLPDASVALQFSLAEGWTAERYDAAKALILRLRDCHDSELPAERPHAALIALCVGRLRERELALSLERGWTLARDASVSPASASPLTPVTRLAPAARLAAVPVSRSGRVTAVTVVGDRDPSQARPHLAQPAEGRRARLPVALAALIAILAAGATLWYVNDRARPLSSEVQTLAEPMRVAANQAADALHRFIRRDREADGTGTATGRAAAPATTTGKNSAASRAPPASAVLPPPPMRFAQAEHSEFPAAGSAGQEQVAGASTSSSATAASAPALSSSPAPREAPAPLRPPPHTPATHASSGTVASTFAPARPASAPSRPASKPWHAQLDKAITTPHAEVSRSATQPRRTHASWASLQPPAWLHGAGPGEPPGAKTHPRYPALASLSAGLAAESAPTAATAARSESPQVSAQPDPAAPTPASEAPRPLSAPAAPAPTRGAPSTVKDERNAAPIAAATGGISAAPVEDRRDALTFGLAQSATPGSRTPAAADANVHQDFAVEGRRTLLEAVPRIARQADPEVARVLWMAANAYHPIQERAVADAARLIRIADDAALVARTLAPAEARQLNDEARVLASRRNIVEAFNVQLRAFGANPRDPDVAGNLALLYLKLIPPQPDVARQLALVAIATRAAQFHYARMEDWHTFAVASALVGREVDASYALLVMLALSGDVERSCVAALNALANYGARLQRPVEAMIYRVQSQGRGYDSSACMWPPNWSALSRLP